MTLFNIDKSLNDFNEIGLLKLKLDEIHIQYKTNRTALIISAYNDELVSVMGLFVGRPIVFTIIDLDEK